MEKRMHVWLTSALMIGASISVRAKCGSNSSRGSSNLPRSLSAIVPPVRMTTPRISRDTTSASTGKDARGTLRVIPSPIYVEYSAGRPVRSCVQPTACVSGQPSAGNIGSADQSVAGGSHQSYGIASVVCVGAAIAEGRSLRAVGASRKQEGEAQRRRAVHVDRHGKSNGHH
ncbi:hypothetical protein BKA62DRAFT_716787 [Auriculariales sp. MPI-PUGE-AT-0066]|nr:hypothetical protein BKA62DRAFT_716787 [Auriculariales sp. MPI-PUGE-AT-0066]